ncbi:MAG: transketolase [Simkaniaceae bacterium]
MDEEQKKILEKIANTIRQLSMEAVEKANSGHPGLPMGCAEFGAFLWGHVLNYNPKNPEWMNRDRFILSAGHGSMFLYSLLHLSGYEVSLEDIKQFRQLHSITPGHPESYLTPGVEATTGPLGQGVGNSVGEALGLKILAEKFNTPEYQIFDSKVYCLAGDGCIEEGISSEASSLAGHLQLDNLVIIYDANDITLDGPLAQSASEDTALRYKAYGFDVYDLDGYDFDQMQEIFSKIKEKQERPVFIRMKTVIGKGSPNKAGTHEAHGSPLGEEELKLAKNNLGLPEEEFYIPAAVKTFFENKLQKDIEKEAKWNQTFENWKNAHPELAREFEMMKQKTLPENLEEEINKIEISEPIAGRAASNKVLSRLGDLLPFLYGGSADLSGSDKTMMKQFPLIEPSKFGGRNIKFGVREFAMATAASGLYKTGMIIPFIGTFLTFSDYMRNAIRLAALSQYQVIYHFTHDSIFLGEDGPTHQAVEHLASLRAMPNMRVIRPADQWEVKGAWIAALKYKGPTALILSRQKLPPVKGTKVPYEEGVGRGAYILKKEQGGKPDFTLMATGSEVSLAVDVAEALEKMGKKVRVISMPCWEIFALQSDEYRESILGGDLGKRVSIEAGSPFGWHRWVGPEGITIAVETFGHSAPLSDLQKEFGFTVDDILGRLLSSVS